MFMSKLLEGKLALVLGIANRWSLAHSIAQAFHREGATLSLTYLGEKQKRTIEELSAEWNVAALLPCDVTKDQEIAALADRVVLGGVFRAQQLGDDNRMHPETVAAYKAAWGESWLQCKELTTARRK